MAAVRRRVAGAVSHGDSEWLPAEGWVRPAAFLGFRVAVAFAVLGLPKPGSPSVSGGVISGFGTVRRGSASFEFNRGSRALTPPAWEV